MSRHVTTNPTRTIRHGDIELALWQISDGPGHPLLVLHGLGESAHRGLPDLEWPGPVWGLDFTGHGSSTVPTGGGYGAEVLVGDVYMALREIGAATLLGRGLGAYIGLLMTGVRPDIVRGLVMDDGPGLAGGGVEPGSSALSIPISGLGTAPDPFALVELSRDVRPPDYVTAIAGFALEAATVDEPITVACRVRPPWVEAIASIPGVVTQPMPDALARYALAAGPAE